MASVFCTRLARIAEEQHTRFHLIQEGDEPLASQIKRYWTGIGLAFPAIGVREAWSAVFVSWCVKQAGATSAEFTFAAAHSRFVHQAIANARRGVGVFHGIDVATAKPEVGDIIHNNRQGTSFDFAFAASHKAYKSHSAIVIETGVDTLGRYALTVGGNESDSIRRARVALTPTGTIRQRTTNPYISVIKTLK
jgi:hypothetical protein